MKRKHCADCGIPMTLNEITFYEYRCETCERKWADTMEAWRHGAENQELDKLYGSNSDEPPIKTIRKLQ